MPNSSSGSARDRSLDMIRGLLLVVMTVDHLHGAVSNVTFESLGFVSAAEGFVFVSGFVAAQAYGRLWLRRPEQLNGTAIRRAGKLYLAHIALVLLVGATVWLGPRTLAMGDPYYGFQADPSATLLKAAALLYQPYLLDVLPLYVLLVLLLPVIVRGAYFWPRITVLVSLASWIAAQFFDFGALVEGSGLFVFSAWQLLFVVGVVLGMRRVRTGVVVSARWLKRLFVPMAAAALLLLLWRHGLFSWAITTGDGSPLPDWQDRGRLGLLRVLDFGAIVGVFAAVQQRWPGVFRQEWLESLGRHSLLVFIWHLPLVLLFKPERFLAWMPNLPEALQLGVDLLVTAVVVGSLTVPVVIRRSLRGREMRAVERARAG